MAIPRRFPSHVEDGKDGWMGVEDGDPKISSK